MERTLETDLWIPEPIDPVFDFFSRAENLERITPRSLSFKVETPLPIEIREGPRIEYSLRVRGLPIRWVSEISEWDPPHRFVDSQIRGPYRLWRHEHSFTSENGGTRIRDRVTYAVPGWIFEPILHSIFVKPDLDRIFRFRQDAVTEALTGTREAAS